MSSSGSASPQSIVLIQLIGPGGAGKSTVGAALAARLGCAFRDLDREFERRNGDIGAFIATHGYQAYARENVAAYLDLVSNLQGTAVLALSSGFMVYPVSVHPAYAAAAEAIARSQSTVVLLPSLDREACVAETVRRQLARPFARAPEREEAIIRERFDRYMALPAMKVETMHSADEVAAAIQARLGARAPDADCHASICQSS